MAWTTPPTWATNDIPSATDLNNLLRDNANYLLSGRPNNQVLRDNGANYTTTSTSFSNVDGTNVSITLTVISGKVLIWFNGGASNGAGSTFFDVTVDGTRVGSGFTGGLCIQSQTFSSPVGFFVEVTGLSAGSHIFNLQWRVNANTGVLRAGSGAGTDDIALVFGVTEIG